jgi:hypothetical protein
MRLYDSPEDFDDAMAEAAERTAAREMAADDWCSEQGLETCRDCPTPAGCALYERCIRSDDGELP